MSPTVPASSGTTAPPLGVQFSPGPITLSPLLQAMSGKVTTSTLAILWVPQHPSLVPSILPTSRPTVRSPCAQFPHLNQRDKSSCQDPAGSMLPLHAPQREGSAGLPRGVAWGGGKRVLWRSGGPSTSSQGIVGQSLQFPAPWLPHL